MDVEWILKEIYSAEKGRVNAAVHDIRDLPVDTEGKRTRQEIFERLLYNTDKDNVGVRATIRGLNAALYFGMPLDHLQRYRDVLLDGITDNDGKVRRVINSVMENFRGTLLSISLGGMTGSCEKDVRTLKELNVNTYVALAGKHDACADEKIRSSIRSAMSRFHCPAFHQLMEEAGYSGLYEEYARYFAAADSDYASTAVFIPLPRLLRKDTPQVKQIRSLYQREEEYSDFLDEMEYTIAAYFWNEDRRMKDRDVKRLLTDIKKRYDKGLDAFGEGLSKELIVALSLMLQERPITHHELRLVIEYLRWAIENRSWMGDPRAYVRWVAFSHGMYTAKEQKEYEKQIEQMGRRLGMAQQEVDAILLRDEAPSYHGDENENSRVSSEFAAMDSREKMRFLLESGTEYPDLLCEWVMEHAKEGDYATVTHFYECFVSSYPDFIPVYAIMAEAFSRKDCKVAKQYLGTGMQELERAEEIPDEIHDQLRSMLEESMRMLDGGR